MTTKEINQSSPRKAGAAALDSDSAPAIRAPRPPKLNPSIKRRTPASRPQAAPADALASFHPAIAAWFRRRFKGPTDAQLAGWPHIRASKDVLIAAPTGSGKTLAAFLVAIDQLLTAASSERKSDDDAGLSVRPEVLEGRNDSLVPRAKSKASATTVLYVSPLKALGNDIQRNLDTPLAEIRDVAGELGYNLAPITAAVRTGDTPQSERQAMVRRPPDILITTPESLYLMLTAARSRETLAGVRTVIVDEIHALARDKRGSHLSLSLARLDHVVAVAGNPRPARIGLSATQRPVEEIAAFLVGAGKDETTSVTETSLAEDGTAGVNSPPTAVVATLAVAQGSTASPTSGALPCTIVDLGHQRDIDLHIEVPPADLDAVASKEQWSDLYDRLAELVKSHRTTLIFVNTRRLSERVAHNLSQRFGGNQADGLAYVEAGPKSEGQAFSLNDADAVVASHHGSLSRDRRLRVEERLKSGQLRALVATASLELGIDIGTIDLVCQIGSPRSIATFLQRVGRSGHALGLRPQGRLFPTTRDELVECAALIRAVKAGRLDRISQPVAPLDILAQQIVAEVSCEEWTEDELFAQYRRSWPYRDLRREDFDEVVEMLAEGVGDGAGRSPPLIHRDRINHILRGRRNARLTALLNGGAIPELGDYRVVADPDETVVGTVGEDWAIESMAGDIFLLGSTSWKIRRVESGAGIVRVEDAHGAPPTIPFWLGEAPGRTLELSEEVGRLRRDVIAALDPFPSDASAVVISSLRGGEKEWGGEESQGPESELDFASAVVIPSLLGGAKERGGEESQGPRSETISSAIIPTLRGGEKERGGEESQGSGSETDRSTRLRAILQDECGLDELGAVEIVDYLRASRDALGLIPSDLDVVFERFFDESGGMQLVIHAPFGARINRAWGLTLRKRFCVNFDFELQAAASDDAIVLSLGPQHSFPIEEAFEYVTSRNAEDALRQAVLYAPTFPTRWRWDASRALAIVRQQAGRKVPPQLQRMRADDLLAAVFPAQVGCQENITGRLEVPDHPLIRQTMADCLYEAMDLKGLLAVLRRIEAGEIQLHARDTIEPSPMAHEILSGKPYTYLDDAPLEERRTRAVTLRRSLPENARDLGVLDEDAIARVRDEAWPAPRDAEEVHDALLQLVAVRPETAPDWQPLVEELTSLGRAATVAVGGTFHGILSLSKDDASPTTSPGESSQATLWIAAENIDLIRHLYPHAQIEPPLTLPPGAAVTVADRDDARARMLRGQMEALGPISVASLADRVCLTEKDVEYGLRSLEAAGFILRGRFTPGLDADEFCDRRLLARVHRYTLDRLRREIDPVSAQDYMRFLLRWHHLTPDTRLEGKAGVRQAVNRLQGFEIAASAWEREVLSARVNEYRVSWLDELCLGGEVAWARLTPRKAPANGSGPLPTRQTPVTLATRSDLPFLLLAVRGSDPVPAPRTGAAAEIYDLLQGRGALFFDEIVNQTRRLRTDVERGLRELVAWGLVTADGFQGLRQLTGGLGQSRSRFVRSMYGGGLFSGAGPSGRWTLLNAPSLEEVDADLLAESLARVLLNRYGVVFRDAVAKESFTLPWREILRALRRLEARGLIRGGRFVSGFVGEQYALPEAVDALRRVRREERTGERVWVSAVDPLNLSGLITPGPRVPSQPGRGILFVDGIPTEDAGAEGGRERSSFDKLRMA